MSLPNSAGEICGMSVMSVNMIFIINWCIDYFELKWQLLNLRASIKKKHCFFFFFLCEPRKQAFVTLFPAAAIFTDSCDIS